MNNYKADTIKQLWCQLVSVQDFDKLRVDENGWANWQCRKLMPAPIWHNLSSKLKSNAKGMSTGSDLLYRPKSLHGIETNNGWNRIYSNADLPKIGNTYLFLVDNRQVTQWCEDGMAFSKSHTHWRDIPEIKMPLF